MMVAFNHLQINNKPLAIRPTEAVVLYGDDLATLHQVKRDNSLGLGRVVSAKALASRINKVVGKVGSTVEMLPECVFVNSDKFIVWHKPRFVGAMWFRVGSGVRSLTVEWPPLLFVVNKSSRNLRIFGLGNNSRPSSNAVLYHAPLMNIDQNGALCLGTASLPRIIDVSTIDACEACLFNSYFTHTNHDFTLRNKTSDAEHVRYWEGKSWTGGMAERVSVSELKKWGRLDKLFGGLNNER